MSNIKRRTFSHNRIQAKENRLTTTHENSIHHFSPEVTHYKLNDYCKLLVECPFEIQKNETLRLFGKYGRIEDFKMIKKSINTAVIKFYRASNALKSFEELNNYSVNGKGKLTIKFDLLNDQTCKGPPNPFKIIVFFDNFLETKRHMKLEDLKEVFKKYGTIVNANMPFDYEKNGNKGYGFITYSKASEAARAIEESNKMYNTKLAFGKIKSNSFFSNVNQVNKNRVTLNEINKENISKPQGNVTQNLTQNQVKLESNVTTKQLKSESYVTTAQIKSQINLTHNQVKSESNETTAQPKLLKNVINTKVIVSNKRQNDKITNSLPFKKRKIEQPTVIEKTINADQSNNKSFNTTCLVASSKIDEKILKELFDLIPGLTGFIKQNDGKYFVEYENELSADYALKKLNNFNISRDETIVVEKRINVKKELIKNLDDKHLNQPNLSFVDYFLCVLKKPHISGSKCSTVPQASQSNDLNTNDNKNNSNVSNKIQNWLI